MREEQEKNKKLEQIFTEIIVRKRRNHLGWTQTRLVEETGSHYPNGHEQDKSWLTVSDIMFNINNVFKINNLN